MWWQRDYQTRAFLRLLRLSALSFFVFLYVDPFRAARLALGSFIGIVSFIIIEEVRPGTFVDWDIPAVSIRYQSLVPEDADNRRGREMWDEYKSEMEVPRRREERR